MSKIDEFYCDRVVQGSGVLRDFSTHFSRIAPQGTTALIVGDENEQNYQTARDVIARFYQIEPINSRNQTVNLVDRIKIKSEIGLIVSVGDAHSLAVGKFLSHKYGLKHIFIALSPCCLTYLSPYATLYHKDGYGEVYSALIPDLVICDDSLITNDDLIADAYGQICARLTALIDIDFRSAVENEKIKQGYSNLLQTIVDLVKEKEITKDKILKYSLASSYYLAQIDWTGDGSTQFAHAVSLYAKKSGKKVQSEEKTDGLCAKIILATYECALKNSLKNGVFVPDNNGYFIALTTALGVSPFRAHKILSKIENRAFVSEKLYRLSLYRAEIYNRAKIYRKTLVFTALKQKRLYKDKGFSYNGYVGREQISRILPLVSEMKGKFTLFSLLKQTGYLRPKL